MYRAQTLLLCIVLATLALAGECLASPPAGLTAHWAFDDGAGNVAVDSSGNGNDGAINGDPQWVTGQIGGALDFDADGDFIDCGNDAIFDVTDELTLAVWVNLRSIPGDWRAVAAKGDDAWRLANNGSAQTMDFAWTGSSRNYMNVASTTALPFNEWHHVCGVYSIVDGGRIYIDGIEEAFVADTEGITTGTFPVYIGNNPQNTDRFWDGLIDDLQLYKRALSAEEVLRIMKGLTSPGAASDPNPADATTDVPRESVLSWVAGDFAATHDVYFGTSLNDVNNASRTEPMDVLVSQGQTTASFDPEAVLQFAQTYYWRVDEVNGAPDNTIFKGEVWSFTVEPLAYPVQNIIATTNGISDAGAGPENTINGSGLDADDQHSIEATDMWLASPNAEPLAVQYEFDGVYKLHEMLVWNYNVAFELILGFGFKDTTVEYSVDGAEWTALPVVTFAQATAKPDYTANTTVAFNGVAAKYVRLTVNSCYDIGMLPEPQYGLSEVRFLYVPASALEPQPADGAIEVTVDSALTWRAGREAVTHDVYLSTDPNALVLVDSVSETSYVAGDIEFGSTYYWRIDETNEADEISVWEGDLWDFSTQEYAVIDDMESYDDEDNRIYETWLDGWVNNSGSIVGYLEAPFAEKSIVHGGEQSMPLQYDNADSPGYSEAERTFDTPQDWTANGANTLALFVRGIAPAFFETPTGEIIMNAVGTDIWDPTDQFRFAYKNLSGNGSIIVRVDSLARSDGWAKAGVMIRETLEPGSTNAYIAISPDNGVVFQHRPMTDGASAFTGTPGLIAPCWVKLTRTGDTFTAQQSEDGLTWIDITPITPVDISMGANVYVGLAVTSHNANIVTGAEFSNISTTGDVSGDWQIAGVGTEQPEGNDAADLYIAIEDSSGKVAVAVNPDTAAVVRPIWHEWTIPFAELSNVDLSRTKTVYIGVGDRNGSTADSAGVIYIDDIGFGRPATAE